MIEQPQYSRALFLFNDNEEEFYTHFKGGQHRCGIGGGNAGIRPYQCRTPQRAVGIPTGSRGAGYARLDAHVRSVLDDAFSQIDRRRATRRFVHRIVYSAAEIPDRDNMRAGGIVI